MKKYILYAGVNGAGKSTLYQTTKYKEHMSRINTDEILREFGDWRNNKDIMTAGKIAVKRLKQYFTEQITFNQETTLCGKSVINSILKAKELGYIIALHYIGVDSVDIAKQRIRDRVASGGHGIPDKDVERRYEESFKNLAVIIPLCDLVALYDNTNQFRRFAILKQGNIVVLSKDIPNWYMSRFVDEQDSEQGKMY